MLRIKEDKMQDLEKLGFKEDDYLEGKPTSLKKNFTTIELYDAIYDKWNTRKIYVSGSAYLDEIYDLIQAGLVEKVGG